MPSSSLNAREFLVALVIIILGLFMVWEGMRYPFGSAQRMGPAFFPIALGVLMSGIGCAIAFTVRGAPAVRLASPLRPFVMIIGGIAAFAMILPRWGLFPATVALVLMSAAGDKPFRPLSAIATALVLALGGYLLFVRTFGLPLAVLRW